MKRGPIGTLETIGFRELANGYLSFVIVSDLFFETRKTHHYDESAEVANGDDASEERRTNRDTIAW